MNIDLLRVSPADFKASPQRGSPWRGPWEKLARALSTPKIGAAKDSAGGYAIGVYRDNVRRKANLITIGALVIDIDEGGDVARVTRACEKYRHIVHETFSSTAEAPRCRLLIALAEPVDAATYDKVHAAIRKRLRAECIGVDEGAKDVSRLSYLPVRTAGCSYAFRAVDGAPLDAQAVLAAQPAEIPRQPVYAPVHHSDGYVRAALRRAAEAVSSASAGGRHHELCKQAWSLARLELADTEIREALLEPFVSAAGEARRREGERTIRDALQARRVRA